jgi:hypothetical protein
MWDAFAQRPLFAQDFPDMVSPYAERREIRSIDVR